MLNGYGITRHVCQKREYFRDIHLKEPRKYFSKHEKHLNGIYFVGDGIGFVEEWRLYFRKYKPFWIIQGIVWVPKSPSIILLQLKYIN